MFGGLISDGLDAMRIRKHMHRIMDVAFSAESRRKGHAQR